MKYPYSSEQISLADAIDLIARAEAEYLLQKLARRPTKADAWMKDRTQTLKKRIREFMRFHGKTSGLVNANDIFTWAKDLKAGPKTEEPKWRGLLKVEGLPVRPSEFTGNQDFPLPLFRGIHVHDPTDPAATKDAYHRQVEQGVADAEKIKALKSELEPLRQAARNHVADSSKGGKAGGRGRKKT